MSKIYPLNAASPSQLISPIELKKKLPATITQTQFVEQSRKKIVHILDDSDPCFLGIIGPCSIHDPKSALEYAQKLKTLASDISDQIYTVMRVHFEKPRTLLGWKGYMYDPHLDGTYDVATGIYSTRELLLELTKMGIPLGTEFLDPLSYLYFGDLISWGCIGARTSSSQIHRQIASGLPLPIGFKNNTDGNIKIAVNGTVASSKPHTYFGLNEQGFSSCVHSSGNPNCHIVLRGGESSSNYDPGSVSESIDLLKEANQPQRLLIDCSHDNSRRDHNLQPVVLRSILDQILLGNDAIKGFILESHLEVGKQPIPDCLSKLKYGTSITDACLDWKTTESLVKNAYTTLKTKSLKNFHFEHVCSI